MFNKEGKDVLTYAESLRPAMEITDREEAQEYFDALLAYHQKQRDICEIESDRTSEEECLINLGYYAGYFSKEVQDRVARLFCAEYPYAERRKHLGS